MSRRAADWDNQVRQLIRDTGMPLITFAEATGFSTAETLNWWSGKKSGLSFSNLESLSRYFGVAAEKIVDGTCSHALVRRRMYLGPEVLPDEYQENASSYVRTTAHIVDYLSLVYGRHFMDRLLLRMNIHPLIFDNLDNRINLRFIIDLLNRLSEQGFADREIESLACYYFLRIQHTEVGKRFAKARTYEESYAVLESIMGLLEANFEYKFEVTSRRVRIHAKPAAALQFLKKSRPKEYERLFGYRRKALGWFPLLSRLAPLNMHTTACFLRGDSASIYEAEFPRDLQGSLFRKGQHLVLL